MINIADFETSGNSGMRLHAVRFGRRRVLVGKKPPNDSLLVTIHHVINRYAEREITTDFRCRDLTVNTNTTPPPPSLPP